MYLSLCVIATEFDYWITIGSELFTTACSWWFERLTWITIEKRKAILYPVDISTWYFFVCHLKIVLYFLYELKQSSSDGTDGRSIQTSLRELITTRSNRMKFRLIKRLPTKKEKKQNIIIIKKKQKDTRPIHYLLFSQVWFVALRWSNYQNIFVLKQESLFFVYLLYFY